MTEVSKAAQAVVDHLLAAFDSSNATQWPLASDIQIEFKEPDLYRFVLVLPAGALFLEGDSLCVGLLGMLHSSRGQAVMDLLVRYLGYWREALKLEPKKAIVASSEIRQALGLDGTQSRQLSQALLVGQLWGGEHRPGGAEHWTASRPKEMPQVMGLDVDLQAFIWEHARRIGEPVAAARNHAGIRIERLTAILGRFEELRQRCQQKLARPNEAADTLNALKKDVDGFLERDSDAWRSWDRLIRERTDYWRVTQDGYVGSDAPGIVQRHIDALQEVLRALNAFPAQVHREPSSRHANAPDPRRRRKHGITIAAALAVVATVATTLTQFGAISTFVQNRMAWFAGSQRDARMLRSVTAQLSVGDVANARAEVNRHGSLTTRDARLADALVLAFEDSLGWDAKDTRNRGALLSTLLELPPSTLSSDAQLLLRYRVQEPQHTAADYFSARLDSLHHHYPRLLAARELQASRPRLARRLLEALAKDAQSDPAHFQALILSWLTQVERQLGDLDDAERTVAKAIDLVTSVESLQGSTIEVRCRGERLSLARLRLNNAVAEQERATLLDMAQNGAPAVSVNAYYRLALDAAGMPSLDACTFVTTARAVFAAHVVLIRQYPYVYDMLPVQCVKAKLALGADDPTIAATLAVANEDMEKLSRTAGGPYIADLALIQILQGLNWVRAGRWQEAQLALSRAEELRRLRSRPTFAHEAEMARLRDACAHRRIGIEKPHS